MILQINKKPIGPDRPTYIIAEVGINHNGRLDLAMKMLKEAAQSGVDAVKIQIVYADQSYTPGSASYAIFKKMELSLEDWQKIVDYAHQLQVDIFASFGQPEDAACVERFRFPAIKISSSNLTNFPLLKAVAALKKPILLSTGLSYLSEVDEAVRFLEKNGHPHLGIFQCTSLYPTQSNEVNLRAISTLDQAFPHSVIGFSDHTLGTHCAVAAVTLGARLLEKHFTLDRQMEGPDHHFSATPQELGRLVQEIRSIEAALGTGVKQPCPEEHSQRDSLQRSIVTKIDIRAGTPFTLANTTIKRSPVKGLEPKLYETILGRPAKKDIAAHDPIGWDSI